MEETLLHISGQPELVDDECSTDSGCSSGGSTESAEASSRRGSTERRYARGRSAGRQERLQRQRADGCKPARSWSPLKPEPEESPVASAAPGEPRSSAARGLRKAFQTLRISAPGPEKSASKKSQKRILRSPVAYTYVKGLSGLPTQRIPRNAV